MSLHPLKSLRLPPSLRKSVSFILDPRLSGHVLSGLNEPLELKDSFEIIITERRNKLKENVWDAYHLEQITDLFC